MFMQAGFAMCSKIRDFHGTRSKISLHPRRSRQDRQKVGQHTEGFLLLGGYYDVGKYLQFFIQMNR
jgi:hypothetical protein